jgi:hypothetical protein
VDPSGNFCVNVGSQQICSDDPDSDGQWYPYPDHTQDPIILTQAGENVSLLFQEWVDTPGWWNNYGASTFTTADFLGIWLLGESSYYEKHLSIQSIVYAQMLYIGGFNSAYCISGATCVNGVFNFIAANIDGNSALKQGPNNLSNQFMPQNNSKDPRDLRRIVRSYGSKALDPRSVVTNKQLDGPAVWGNVNGWKRIKQLNEANQFSTAKAGVWFQNDQFTVFTVNQWNYWFDLKVDMTPCKTPECE